MEWHPRGAVISAGADDGTVWLWNAVNGHCMHVFSGNAIRSTAGCFSPDGRWLVSAGEGIVQVWNPREGKAEVTYDRAQGHPVPEAEIISLAVNPASTLIAAGAADGSLVVMHLTHFQVRTSLLGHSDAIEGLSFHPNPKLNFLVSAGLDAQIYIWDLNTFQVRKKCGCDKDEGITSLRWLADPDTFITASVNGLVSVWDGRSGDRLDQMGLKDVPCLNIAPLPTMSLLFCAYDNGRLVSFAYN
jgi:ribosome assembly protein SQT1